MFLSFVCGAVLRGAGDSRTPLAAAVLANIVNIVVAYALIFGHFGFPALGVAGSAFGAASGRGVGAAYMLLAMARGERRSRCVVVGVGARTSRPLDSSSRSACRPPSNRCSRSGAFMTLIAVVALIGTSALAAQQIAFTAFRLRSCPDFGFSIAATALVGQSIGARLRPMPKGLGDRAAVGRRLDGHWRRARLHLRRTLMRIFSSDPEVISSGVAALHALSFALPFWALWFVSSGGLRGSGDTRTPLIVGASTMWLSVFLAWIGVRWFDGGMGWVWPGFVLTTAPASILMWWIFRQRIGEYERGRRELPMAKADLRH